MVIFFFFFFLKAEIVALFLHSNLVFGFLLKNWKFWSHQAHEPAAWG